MRGNLWTPGSVPREAAPKTALWLSGAASNNVSTPHSAALAVTGDLDIRVSLTRTSWAADGNKPLVSKYTAGSPAQVSFRFFQDQGGKLGLAWSADGAAQIIKLSTVVMPESCNGVQVWLRATLDVDNGGGQNEVKFYTSPDGTTWTQLGTTVTTAAVTSIFDGTAPVEIGGFTALPAYTTEGLFHEAEVRNGIDGPIVAQWNGSYPHTRQRDPQGNIWTVNGTANAWQKVGN